MGQNQRFLTDIFEEATSFVNLHRAFQKAYRAGKKSLDAQRFFFHLEEELFQLQSDLRSSDYLPGPFYRFTVRDPKERVISVAPFRDRVVHHTVVAALEPFYERRFIYDSYATRKGKGTHLAIQRAQSFLRRYPWYLKMDIRKYFDSVSQPLLYNRISSRVKDPRMMHLLGRLIFLKEFPGTGMPIGNLTSQFFANIYLDPFDHWVKDQLGIKGYVRYMDDFVLFSQDKRDLSILREKVERYIRESLSLEIKEEATAINSAVHGLTFLGLRIFPNLLRLRRQNLHRSLNRLKNQKRAWENGKIQESDFLRRYASIMGHLEKAHTYRFRVKHFG